MIYGRTQYGEVDEDGWLKLYLSKSDVQDDGEFGAASILIVEEEAAGGYWLGWLQAADAIELVWSPDAQGTPTSLLGWLPECFAEANGFDLPGRLTPWVRRRVRFGWSPWYAMEKEDWDA